MVEPLQICEHPAALRTALDAQLDLRSKNIWLRKDIRNASLEIAQAADIYRVLSENNDGQQNGADEVLPALRERLQELMLQKEANSCREKELKALVEDTATDLLEEVDEIVLEVSVDADTSLSDADVAVKVETDLDGSVPSISQKESSLEKQLDAAVEICDRDSQSAAEYPETLVTLFKSALTELLELRDNWFIYSEDDIESADKNIAEETAKKLRLLCESDWNVRDVSVIESDERLQTLCERSRELRSMKDTYDRREVVLQSVVNETASKLCKWVRAMEEAAAEQRAIIAEEARLSSLREDRAGGPAGRIALLQTELDSVNAELKQARRDAEESKRKWEIKLSDLRTKSRTRREELGEIKVQLGQQMAQLEALLKVNEAIAEGSLMREETVETETEQVMPAEPPVA